MVLIRMPNGVAFEFEVPPATLEPSAFANGPPSTFNSMKQSPILDPSAPLHNKIALITDASRGIGRGCALELARRGASIIFSYATSMASAQAVVNEINAIGRVNGCTAAAIRADAREPAEITHLFEEAKRLMGHIDIVVSNSGTECWDKTEDTMEERYEQGFSVNRKTQFFMGQAAMKYCEDGGRVVLMSTGLLGAHDHALCSSSEMAVQGMVQSFATGFGRRDITINGIAPGSLERKDCPTNAFRRTSGATPDWRAEKVERLMAEQSPIGRRAVPEEVARVVCFLCSEDGGWVNGQIVTVPPGLGQ